MAILYAVQTFSKKIGWQHAWFDTLNHPIVYEEYDDAQRDLNEFVANARNEAEESGVEFVYNPDTLQVREIGEIVYLGSFHKKGSNKTLIRTSIKTDFF